MNSLCAYSFFHPCYWVNGLDDFFFWFLCSVGTLPTLFYQKIKKNNNKKYKKYIKKGSKKENIQRMTMLGKLWNGRSIVL